MKRKFLLSGWLLMATALVVYGIAMFSTAGSAFDGRMITVLNPAVSEQPAKRVPLTSRLDTLHGKTVYLVDMNYEGIGGTPVMKEMQRWFAENKPEVNAIYRLKRGNYVSDDPELWKEIREKGGDAVIMGVAG